MNDTTLDAFLGGRLAIKQPRKGYRAGADPVLLAAAVNATSGQSVLELGTGVGVALLALCARVEGLEAFGIDIQHDLCELARNNAARNDIEAEIVEADIESLPAELLARSFDHVIANPPYFLRNAGHSSDVRSREIGRRESLSLVKWIDMAVRRLKPGGHLAVIQRAERLPDLLNACDKRLGDVTLQPLAPRTNRVTEQIILTARKGARGDFRLLSPIYLHDGPVHDRDRDDYSPLAKSILRDGLGLEDAKLIHR